MLHPMETARRQQLARSGDWSREATAVRFRGAIRAVGLTQSEFARRSGQTPTAVNNTAKAVAFPSRRTMQELYRTHRIDPTFILFGDFGQMPMDVQDRVFLALEYEAALARDALEQVEEYD
jgi:transcriptional regulator with XRE-family HTH domain